MAEKDKEGPFPGYDELYALLDLGLVSNFHTAYRLPQWAVDQINEELMLRLGTISKHSDLIFRVKFLQGLLDIAH